MISGISFNLFQSIEDHKLRSSLIHFRLQFSDRAIVSCAWCCVACRDYPFVGEDNSRWSPCRYCNADFTYLSIKKTEQIRTALRQNSPNLIENMQLLACCYRMQQVTDRCHMLPMSLIINKQRSTHKIILFLIWILLLSWVKWPTVIFQKWTPHHPFTPPRSAHLSEKNLKCVPP